NVGCSRSHALLQSELFATELRISHGSRPVDLSCPACGTPLQATATDQVTVIVCPRCSHVIRVPHDGGAHSLTITATIPAPPAAALETTAEQVEETYSHADERRWGDSRATSFVPGTRLGDYELIAEIAHGGMGVV